MSNRDLKQMTTEAQKKGWRIERTNGGHLRWQHPNGAVVFTASTPSDNRAIKNIRRWIRRAEQGLSVR